MAHGVIRQMWTAFGIMIGNVMDLAFYHVPDTHNITGLNWRLMLGSVRAIFIPISAIRNADLPRDRLVFPLSLS